MASASESSDATFELLSSLRYDPLLLSCPDNNSIYRKDSTPTPLYMLQFHKDRIFAAAQHFRWHEAISKLNGVEGLNTLEQTLSAAVSQQSDPDTPIKLRVLLSRTGVLTVEATPTPPVSLEDLFPKELKHHDTFTPSSKTGGALLLGSGDQAFNDSAKTMNSGPWRVSLDSLRTTPSSFTKYKTTFREVYADARARACIPSYQELAEVLLINPRGEVMEGTLTSVYFFRQGRWVTPPITSGGHDGTTRKWLLSMCRCFEEVIVADSVVEGEECYLSNGVRGVIWGRICKSEAQPAN
ncbi:MAG: hypothetical protein M1812_003657 [Candelaria pacifica]|nr:MAG: hypothetical protein M1812_003657 [Candelaria pacifica]